MILFYNFDGTQHKKIIALRAAWIAEENFLLKLIIYSVGRRYFCSFLQVAEFHNRLRTYSAKASWSGRPKTTMEAQLQPPRMMSLVVSCLLRLFFPLCLEFMKKLTHVEKWQKQPSATLSPRNDESLKNIYLPNKICSILV